MKILVGLLFLAVSGSSVKDVVAEFHALRTEKTELAFIKKYNSNKEASVRVYVLAAKMKQAEYTMNPVKKIQIFKRYKNELNALVKANPKNIHAHYIRLVIQEKTPSFIGYNDFLKEDKRILRTYLKSEHASAYLEKLIKKNTSL